MWRMCFRRFILFFTRCFVLLSANSTFETMDISLCSENGDNQTELPNTTRGAIFISLPADNFQKIKTCQRKFISQNKTMLFVLQTDSSICSHVKQSLIRVDEHAIHEENFTMMKTPNLKICDTSVDYQDLSFQSFIQKKYVGKTLMIKIRFEVGGKWNSSQNIALFYTSFRNRETFLEELCDQCMTNDTWAVEAGACEFNEFDCSDTNATSPKTTLAVADISTKCYPMPIGDRERTAKSEFMSIFVSGFIVLTLVLVALHCGGSNSGSKSSVVPNASVSRHPALGVGDGMSRHGGGNHVKMKGGSSGHFV